VQALRVAADPRVKTVVVMNSGLFNDGGATPLPEMDVPKQALESLHTPVLYVLGEATATTGSVLFWSRLMDGFTSRDQKRVVGVVGGGGMLGSALAGLLLKLTVGVTGVVLPMMLAAVLWVAALPLLQALRSRSLSHDVDPATTGTATAPKRRPVGMRESLQALTGSAYTRGVALLVVLLAATGASSDFVFRAAAARTGSEEDMAGLFGLLNAVVGIVVVVLQVGRGCTASLQQQRHGCCSNAACCSHGCTWHSSLRAKARLSWHRPLRIRSASMAMRVLPVALRRHRPPRLSARRLRLPLIRRPRPQLSRS
jgi:hypothetical protein